MNTSFLSRMSNELKYWRQKTWTFSEVGAHWDSTEEYDSINEATYSYFRRFEDGLRLSGIPEGSFILDICSRTGKGTEFFYKNGRVNKAICVDVSFEMGKICEQRLIEIGLKDFSWIPIGNYTLPFLSGVFDAVLCFETIEHFSEPDRLISDLGRVTRKGGILVLTTPNIFWEPIHALAAITNFHHSEGPHRFIRHSRLVNMVNKAGFDIECEETTVLIPGGPNFIIRFGEWIENRTKNTFMPLLGLRRIIIGKKR